MRKRQKKKLPVVCFRRWKRKRYAVFASLGKQIKIGVLCASYSMLTMNVQTAAAKGVVADTSSVDKTRTLDEVVVASERPPQLAPLMQVVAVIQRSDIERAAVQNLQDLLRYIAGIDLRARGNNNVQADISLRGGTFDQTVVLLNGVNITDPQTGHYSLDIPINLNNVTRIEVLQGPGAWTAGAVAYSGAINIITALPEKNTIKADFAAGAYGYFDGGIAGGISTEPFQATLSANHSQSIGYTDNTDFRVDNVALQARYHTKQNGAIDGQFGYQQKNYGANSFYTPAYPKQFEHTETWLGSLRYSFDRQVWGFIVTTSFREHFDRYELTRDKPPYNYHRTDVAGALLQVYYTSRFGTSTAGINYRYEHIFSNKLGEPLSQPIAVHGEEDTVAFYTCAKTRQHATGFLQHTFRINKFSATLGLMGAGNSDYGFQGYAGANLSYDFTYEWQLTASGSNSYRLPTFTDLYYTSPSQQGNPGLLPEEAVTGELAARYRNDAWRGMVSGFYRYGVRMIDWVRRPGNTKWYAENLTNVHYCGANIVAEYTPQKQFLKKAAINYGYLYMQPTESGVESNYAVDYLQHKLSATLQHGIWRYLSAAWQLTFASRAGTYMAYPSQTETGYKPYWLCDLKIYWDAKYYNIFVEATNLFNVDYSDIANVPQPGIWLKAGIAVQI